MQHVICKTSDEFLRIAMDRARCAGFQTTSDGVTTERVAWNHSGQVIAQQFTTNAREFKALASRTRRRTRARKGNA